MSREALRQQFVSLKQGSGTVQDYNMKCDNLMRYAPDIVADDFRLRRQYLEGLHPRFTKIIDLPGTVRLVDLMAHALRVESYEPSKGQQSFVLNVKPRVDGSSIKAKSVNEFPAISKSS
jgi:hypothetical protein